MQVVRELTDLTRLQQILESHGGSRECSVNQLLNAVEYNNADDRDNKSQQMQAKKNVMIMFLPFSRVTFFSVRRPVGLGQPDRDKLQFALRQAKQAARNYPAVLSDQLRSELEAIRGK